MAQRRFLVADALLAKENLPWVTRPSALTTIARAI